MMIRGFAVIAGSCLIFAAGTFFYADNAHLLGAHTPKTMSDCEACPDLVYIDAGSFKTGRRWYDLLPILDPGRSKALERRRGKHTLSESFFLQMRETSVADFGRFVQATGYEVTTVCEGMNFDTTEEDPKFSWQSPGYQQLDQSPAVCLGFEDVTAYAEWLSAMTGHVYRLPTENEFEYAQRGGSKGIYPWGNRRRRACLYANVGDDTGNATFGWTTTWLDNFHCDDGRSHAAPIDRSGILPNAFGLFDMTGNVAEYVSDCFAGLGDRQDELIKGLQSMGLEVVPEPVFKTADGCEQHLVKGSEWGATPIGARPSFRFMQSSKTGNALVGFRLVRELEEKNSPYPAISIRS